MQQQQFQQQWQQQQQSSNEIIRSNFLSQKVPLFLPTRWFGNYTELLSQLNDDDCNGGEKLLADPYDELSLLNFSQNEINEKCRKFHDYWLLLQADTLKHDKREKKFLQQIFIDELLNRGSNDSKAQERILQVYDRLNPINKAMAKSLLTV